MNSTFFGLELSRRALESQQVALDISGHNIANANTAGYSRQIANLTATTPDSVLASGRNLSLGSGVTLDTITRARDAFVDRQFRSETSKQQYWGEKQDNLTKVEDILNEPSDNSLSSDMSQFYTAWSDLSNDPTNAGARSVVSERAQELTDSFHNIAQQASDLSGNMDAAVKVQVTQINTYANQIKDLNDQIRRAEVAGDNPNDLRDQRDSLVDDLSKIVNVKVVETKDPSFTDRTVNNYKVIIGDENSPTNNILVDGSTVNSLMDPPSLSSSTSTSTNPKPGLALVTWSDGTSVNLGTQQGTLSADLDVRDQNLTKFMDQLDTLAQGIASAVNALHQTGQGLTAETQTDPTVGPVGIDFFTNGSNPASTTPPALPVVTASNITLNSVIALDPNRIATGAIPLNTSTNPPTHAVDANGNALVTAGDGTIAQGISSLSTGWNALQAQIDNGTFDPTASGAKLDPVSASSLGDYYAANVAQLGVDVQQATRMKAGEDVLVTNVTNQRSSLSGVSLDEEMTNLVKFQKSYSAAARLVTMMDSMFDSILSMGMTK